MADGSGMGKAGLDGLPCGICLVSMDDEERVLYANRSFLLLMGFSSMEELFSQRGSSFKGLVDEGYVPLGRRCGAEERSGTFYFRLKTPSGSVPVKGTAGGYEDEEKDRAWCLSCIRDREGKARDLQLMDRRTFYPAITRQAREDVKKGIFGSRAPLYFNLTNFKVYNSRHGTEAGDRLIRFMAESIASHFPYSIIAHLTGDTFAVLALHHDVAERIEAVSRDIRNFTGDPAVQLKAGVNIFNPDEVEISESGIHLLFDRAKIAADWIKGDAGRTFAVYDKSMGQHLTDRVYVLGNFDRALKEGHIKVYYQPVIRTLTGKVCGMEALARWEDPVRGMIMPSIFVPVLEEAGLIHRLDCYVIETVAKLYRFIMENHRPFVPVSVNLSAVDFEVMDPFSFVEDVVEKYQVPRNFFHIEITESALKKNEMRLRQEIEKFRKAGYECWLDDFGSGYSSLNVLKTYRFDTLKLDMAFQRNQNDWGRKIMGSIIYMAKKLGIHTLAEGVETRAQAEFLKSMGCEKIQGWYYGKALPYEESYRYCLHRHLAVETPLENSFYEKLGLANIIGDTPAALFLYDGENIAILLGNEASRRAAAALKATCVNENGLRLVKLDLPVMQQFHELLSTSAKSGRKESMNYIFHGQYMRCTLQVLAQDDHSFAGKMEYYLVSDGQDRKETHRMDKLLRHLFIVYDGLYVIRKKEALVEVAESMNRIVRTGETVPLGRFLKLGDFMHPEDRERFLRIMEPGMLEKKANRSKRNAVTGLFRMKMDDGSYRWKEFNFALLGSSWDGDILLGIKDTASAAAREAAMLPSYLATLGPLPEMEREEKRRSSVLQAMAESGNICFFWKDREHRFLGASRAFLEKYGFTLSDILGKTDDEIGWHVNGRRFQNEEEKVLKKGAISRNVMGQCIIKGQIHYVQATKFPIYRGNEIAGLAGYFIDRDSIGKIRRENQELDIKDMETGLLNYRGMFITAIHYFDNYKSYGENCAALFMDIPALDDVSRLYGMAVRKKLLARLAKLISHFFRQGAAIAHLGGGRFCVLMKAEDTADIRRRMLDLSNEVHGIREEAGRQVTLFLQYALVMASEVRTVDELFHLLARRLVEAERGKYGESLYYGDRIVFDRAVFDNSSDQIMISDPDTYSLLYVNKAGLRDLGLPEDYPYAGRKCYELICGESAPCEVCPQAFLRRDRFYTQTFHNMHTGGDYLIQHTLISWHGKNGHFELATNLGGYAEGDYRKKYMLFQEMAVNDALAAGISALTPHEGISRLLARVGKILEAEKVCIFEEQGDGTVKNTYEWCAPGIEPSKDAMQHVPMELVRPIYDSFGPDQIAIIDDVEAVQKEYGIEKEAYRPGLKRLISGHLVIGGLSLGYTEVVNPSEKIMKEASPLLDTLTRFGASLIRNRNVMDRLQALSHEDQLTGLRNRLAFMEYVESLPVGTKTAFLFGDMNGLKQINDKEGHEAGDRALQTLAAIAGEMVGLNHAFRMGGDEFILAVEGADKARAVELAAELKGKLHLQNLSMALGIAIRTAPIIDIDELIMEMDKKMYEDKRHPRR